MSAKETKARAVAPAGPAQPTREAILDAAEQMFSAKGVDGVAVRDLARELGLTASSLYNHFPGKQALYEAVLERGLRPIVDLIASAWQDALEPESIARTLDAMVAHLAEHPHLGRLLQRALLEQSEGVHELIGRWLAPIYSQGVGILAQGARDAGWEREEVPNLALGLFGLLFAYFVHGERLAKYGIFGGDAFAPHQLQRQRRFLEKALFRLLGRQPRA